ncbi:MAG: hypothetical protein Q9Q40_10145 [Acidobacteriota bacterium]|nr:hypothetical protein [Acidobacteriota bacterium]MDQ7088722.1 hypothetical protein [Acidobacteriota bacterium]
MSADLIVRSCLYFLGAWGLICVLHGLVLARQDRWEPAAPEPPDHHGH